MRKCVGVFCGFVGEKGLKADARNKRKRQPKWTETKRKLTKRMKAKRNERKKVNQTHLALQKESRRCSVEGAYCFRFNGLSVYRIIGLSDIRMCVVYGCQDGRRRYNTRAKKRWRTEKNRTKERDESGKAEETTEELFTYPVCSFRFIVSGVFFFVPSAFRYPVFYFFFIFFLHITFNLLLIFII